MGVRGKGHIDWRFFEAFFATEEREGRLWLRRRSKPSPRRTEERDYRFRLAVAEIRDAGFGKRHAKEIVRNRAGTLDKRKRRHGRR